MTPDQAERIARLETSMADVRSEQARQGADLGAFRRELGSLRDLVQTLVPIAKDTAVLREQVDRVETDVSRVESKFDRRLDGIEALITEERRTREAIREQERQEANRIREARAKESKTERQWRIGLAVTIALGILAAVITIVIALASASGHA